jgi:hypothetical protein
MIDQKWEEDGLKVAVEGGWKRGDSNVFDST